jgi:hypothetical protein
MEKTISKYTFIQVQMFGYLVLALLGVLYVFLTSSKNTVFLLLVCAFMILGFIDWYWNDSRFMEKYSKVVFVIAIIGGVYALFIVEHSTLIWRFLMYSTIAYLCYLLFMPKDKFQRWVDGARLSVLKSSNQTVSRKLFYQVLIGVIGMGLVMLLFIYLSLP